jgi:hypothetical protein
VQQRVNINLKFSSVLIFREVVTTYIFLESNFLVDILNIADVNYEKRC